jgi:GxxExxY protein
MNTDQRQIRGKHDDLTEKIIGVFYDVYNELGYGFLEIVYRNALGIALEEAGLNVKIEVPVPVHFRDRVVGMFRADLIVNDAVLLELKSCEGLIKEHESQTLHYLRSTDIEVALLMNFGPVPRFKRLAFDNERKTLRSSLKESVSSVGIGVMPFFGGDEA